MGRAEELSDFKRGTVIGCHLCHKSVREISALLDLPRSTVSAVIVKWKRVGATTAQPRSGRPRKLTEEGRKELERVAQKSRSSVASLTAEFQSASGSDISTRTVRRELHGMGLLGRGAARKPHTATRNAKQCKAGQAEVKMDQIVPEQQGLGVQAELAEPQQDQSIGEQSISPSSLPAQQCSDASNPENDSSVSQRHSAPLWAVEEVQENAQCTLPETLELHDSRTS